MEFPSFSEIEPPAASKVSFQKEALHHESFHHFYLPCFYAKLFKKIEPSDLTNKERLFPENCPLSYMIPLLEMTEHHFHYIRETLYLTTHSARPSPLKFEDYALNKDSYPSISRLFMPSETPL